MGPVFISVTAGLFAPSLVLLNVAHISAIRREHREVNGRELEVTVIRMQGGERCYETLESAAALAKRLGGFAQTTIINGAPKIAKKGA
jgi:hypothetical protein